MVSLYTWQGMSPVVVKDSWALRDVLPDCWEWTEPNALGVFRVSCGEKAWRYGLVDSDSVRVFADGVSAPEGREGR